MQKKKTLSALGKCHVYFIFYLGFYIFRNVWIIYSLEMAQLKVNFLTIRAVWRFDFSAYSASSSVARSINTSVALLTLSVCAASLLYFTSLCFWCHVLSQGGKGVPLYHAFCWKTIRKKGEKNHIIFHKTVCVVHLNDFPPCFVFSLDRSVSLGFASAFFLTNATNHTAKVSCSSASHFIFSLLKRLSSAILSQLMSTQPTNAKTKPSILFSVVRKPFPVLLFSYEFLRHGFRLHLIFFSSST